MGIGIVVPLYLDGLCVVEQAGGSNGGFFEVNSREAHYYGFDVPMAALSWHQSW